MSDPIDISALKIPGFLHPQKKVLLHVCCAPCCASILHRMLAVGLEPTVFFYNPNIYPREEYNLRKNEVIHYAGKRGIPFIDRDGDGGLWFETVKGHELEPERGERCGLCFDMRLGKSAAYASENGFRVFTSSLGISRWKDFDQVTRAGLRAAAAFPGLAYWDMNWRKDGGSGMMSRLAAEEGFYRQNYCGCLYSLRNRTEQKRPLRENRGEA
ncbi:MAG TPA: epoxyqueuosine reductase QueH [Candidatus Omnitrophota bacterium]|jgi:hypothetical protein|nr:MAG: hypothetical protein BWY49_00314 [Candidatus Omnitrophica bacterium ADurb.Bin314]HOE69102.1 epoxyqueuosine reductase QueH [Candidatus Omnitrophota bacterium]HQB93626.1 epoxyqueuosine reductase QueH [Candidatus Omnitrophota bacterium]